MDVLLVAAVMGFVTWVGVRAMFYLAGTYPLLANAVSALAGAVVFTIIIYVS